MKTSLLHHPSYHSFYLPHCLPFPGKSEQLSVSYLLAVHHLASNPQNSKCKAVSGILRAHHSIVSDNIQHVGESIQYVNFYQHSSFHATSVGILLHFFPS